MKVDITRKSDKTLHAVCKECNKPVDIIVLGRPGLCNHGVVLSRHNSDDVDIMEIKRKV